MKKMFQHENLTIKIVRFSLGRTLEEPTIERKKFISIFCFLQLQITELEKIIIKE